MLTLQDIGRSIVLDLVLQGQGPMDDEEVLGAAKARAILEDGHEMRSKLLQKIVCKMLFELGYEYGEPYFFMPANEEHREQVRRSNRLKGSLDIEDRPLLSLAPGE